MLELRDLRMVQAIHAQGSLARAARILNIGQPALSRSLAALEARLHGVLFERSRRGVTPTNLCRTLLADGAEIITRMEQLDRRLSGQSETQAGTLRVVAGGYLSETVGIVAAARMLSGFPELRMRLTTANWIDVPRAVREREASIGLLDTRELGEPDDLLVERMPALAGIFVARPDHPLAGVAGLDLADIMAWPLVQFERIPRAVLQIVHLAREEARARGRLHPIFPAMIHESPTVALAALDHSDAITTVTAAMAAPLVRSGKLAALSWRGAWVSVHGGILRARHSRPSEAEQAFLDLVRSASREAEALGCELLGELGLHAATG